MNEIIELGITREEAVAMDAEMERMLAAMRKANEQIARDQVETDKLQAETRVILDRMKERKITSISRASSLKEIADYWDSHSLADYWDQTHEVNFTVTATRRRRVTLDPEVYQQVEAEARTRGIMPETLVNMLLADRLHEMRVSG